eukprot:15123587-Alexandrium_andersonii.AAC.1
MAAYGRFVYRGGAFAVPELTVRHLRESIAAARSTAPGPDGWSTAEWKHLPDRALMWLVRLLRGIEH